MARKIHKIVKTTPAQALPCHIKEAKHASRYWDDEWASGRHSEIVIHGVHILCRTKMTVEEICEYFPRPKYVKEVWTTYRKHGFTKNQWFGLSTRKHVEYLNMQIEIHTLWNL